MPKPTILLVTGLLCTYLSFSQKTDSLVLFYKPDQYSISRQDKLKLDSFSAKGWDRISINGFTDETDDEEHNLELSKKRSGEVYRYFIERKIPIEKLQSQFFGESLFRADNETEEGKAMNRRTVIIGWAAPKMTVRPKDLVDPMKPVTTTHGNGVMITYRPGALPDDVVYGLETGLIEFKLLSNTQQMREWNLWNNTTNGEILSSVMIVCGRGFNPCKLDSPILVRVPIPVSTKCPIEKVKFFNAVAERGKQIWSEQSKQIFPETVNGQQFVSVWMDNFCQCINFDFKIDPDCFDVDSTKLMYVNARVKGLSTELSGLNSVYEPRKINDTTNSIIYIKDQMHNASVSFALYNGKRRIKTFYNRSLDAFPYDEQKKSYVLTTSSEKFYFPRVRVFDVVVKVNEDRYRVYPDKKKCEVWYLNRKAEKITVDFTVEGRRGSLTVYKDQPLASLPIDPATGYRVIDRNFIKLLKEKASMASK